MKSVTATEFSKAAAPALLGYHETRDIIRELFYWKPGPLARWLVRALAKVTRPLEHGSYEGRPLKNEPHRASWVLAGPLTVFLLPRCGFFRRVLLAARLRQPGGINVASCGRFSRSFSRVGAGERLAAPGLTHGGGKGSIAPDDLEVLLTLQRQSSVSLTLVPVAITSHQLSPEAPAGSLAARAYRVSPLNLFRKATSLARTFRTGRLKNAKPLVLQAWLGEGGGRPEPDASALRLELTGRIRSEQRACSGPPLEPAREVKKKVLADPVLCAYMQEYAHSEGLALERVLEEARSYVEEIASDYRVGVVRWFARAVDFLFDHFLDGIEVDRQGIRFLSECEPSSRVVLVCSHKSYLDPLLIGYAMFRSGLVPPHQAAGLNLSFWPVGWLLRHSGAFYLRRSFQGEKLYREVFSAYVRYLLAANYLTVVYVEGTRSRDGKLGRPRTGYLGILAEALRMGVCPDITLVPVYLGYEKIPEEGSHVREMAGGGKVGESVRGFARIYRSVNTRLGRAFVRFARPLSMRALLTERGLEGTAEEVCRGINEVTPITARSVAAAALLSSGEERVSREEVLDRAGMLLGYAERGGFPLDATREGVSAAVDWLVRDGHVALESEEVYSVAGKGRRYLEYYKNMVVHHFLRGAVAAFHREGGDGRGARLFLEEILDEEFVYSADGVSGVSEEEARVMAGTIESFVEGYLVAAVALAALGDGMSSEEFVARSFREGERLLVEGAVRREESVSRVTFKNALRWFEKLQISRLEYGDGGRVAVTPGDRYSELEAVTRKLGDLLDRR